VLDGFARLRHDAVVGSTHQNDDVGGLRTPGTHGGKRFVARCVEEGHHATRCVHMVSPNVLGNAARLASGHFGAANVVEQRGFAVIDVTHDGDDRGTGQLLGIGRRHLVFGEGLRIVERGSHRLVAQFFDHDHGRVLVKRLVDGDHLTELHKLLDDLGRLDGHFVGQFGHRDRLGHMNLENLGFGRGSKVGIAVVTPPLFSTLGARAPVAGTAARVAGVATGFEFFLFASLVFPGGRQGFGFDFPLACARCSWRARDTRSRSSRGIGRFVQGAFDAGLGLGRLGLFGLFGHQHLFRGGHHGTNGLGLGQRLAATLVQLFGSGRFRGFFCLGLLALRLGFGTRLLCSGVGWRWLHRGWSGYGSGRRGHGRGLGGGQRGLAGGLLGGSPSLRLLAEALGLGFSRCTGFGLFALTATLSQLFFLAAQQFGLLASLLLTACQFCFVNDGRRRCLWLRHFVVTLDKCALLAHFHLNGAGSSRRVGLLDFGGRLFGERDFFALGTRRAVAGLQIAEQALFVVFRQRVGTRLLLYPCAGQLLQQQRSGFIELGGEFCDGITSHK